MPEVLSRLEHDHPDADGVLDAARALTAEVIAWTAERGLLPYDDGECLVGPAPESRSYAMAMMSWAAPGLPACRHAPRGGTRPLLPRPGAAARDQPGPGDPAEHGALTVAEGAAAFHSDAGLQGPAALSEARRATYDPTYGHYSWGRLELLGLMDAALTG